MLQGLQREDTVEISPGHVEVMPMLLFQVILDSFSVYIEPVNMHFLSKINMILSAREAGFL